MDRRLKDHTQPAFEWNGAIYLLDKPGGGPTDPPNAFQTICMSGTGDPGVKFVVTSWNPNGSPNHFVRLDSSNAPPSCQIVARPARWSMLHAEPTLVPIVVVDPVLPPLAGETSTAIVLWANVPA